MAEGTAGMPSAAGMPFHAGQAVAATGAGASCVDDIFKVCLNTAVVAGLTDKERKALEVFSLSFLFQTFRLAAVLRKG